MTPKRILHIAAKRPAPAAWPEVMIRAMSRLGEFRVFENGNDLSGEALAARIREFEILVTSWGSVRIPEGVVADRGRLEYVCNLTGSVREWIPLSLLEAGIPVTNWGDSIARPVAEGAMALLLAVLKDIPHQLQQVRSGGWQIDLASHGGSLEGAAVGLYGCGAIGRAFVDMLRPFGPSVRIFDPYATVLPEGCERVESLEELFRASRIVVVHAGLTGETRGSVTAELLSLLPRHGIVINTARGAIIDQAALFRELESGRLRAGLDVLDPDGPLPPGHPARHWDNVIFSAHQAGSVAHGWPMDGAPPTALSAFQRVCLENIRRHLAGEPLRFLMDRERYLRST